ncbi:MAG: hypothetical protein H6813_03595 [Phycisphaeraceae bacterium]|nr:hypothetical protein [Phycisphaeraceae bacterium]MCB9847031.1 hypothetical protein [Phycisphaeraceae bacterium]
MNGAYLFELDPREPALGQVRAEIERRLDAQWPPELRRCCREFLAEWRFAEALLIAEALDRAAGLLEVLNRSESPPAPLERRSAGAPLRRRRSRP